MLFPFSTSGFFWASSGIRKCCQDKRVHTDGISLSESCPTSPSWNAQDSAAHKWATPWAKGKSRWTEVCALSYPERIMLSCVNSATSSCPSVTFFPLWVWSSGLRNADLAATPSPRGHALFSLKRQTDLSIEHFQYTSFSKMYVMNFVFKIL